MIKMKLEVGAEVTIKKDLVVNDRYGNALNDRKAMFAHSMKQYLGKKAKITKISTHGYRLDIDNGTWTWTEDMVDVVKKEKPAIEVKTFVQTTGRQVIQLVKVIYNNPTTILFYKSDLGKEYKVIAKCAPEDTYNKEKGLQACVLKAIIKESNRELRKL